MTLVTRKCIFQNLWHHAYSVVLCSALTLALGSQELAGTAYDEFSGWNIPLSQFEAEAEYLAVNKKAAVRLLNTELNYREKNDPDFRSLTINNRNDPEFKKLIPFCPPYDFNRLRSDVYPDLYINASLVHTSEQEFILAGCPVIREQATEIFMHLLKGWAPKRVWVSLHETGEKSRFCNDFWVPEFVKSLPLRERWRLVRDSTTVLGEGIPSSAKRKKPQLIKTTLVFSDGHQTKTIYHLHYDGWADHTSCPNVQLFLKLLDEMTLLNGLGNGRPSPHVPIVINCMGGVGRTGMTALGYMCSLKIRACPKEKLSILRFNIPELLYALRKARPNMCENNEHIITLYSFLGQLYSLKLKN